MRWLLPLLLVAALAAQSPQLDRAWDLVANGDYRGAAALLKEATARNANDADAHLLLGSVLSELGDKQGAVSHLRTAVALRPRSVDAHFALAEALKKFGDLPSALPHFREASTLRPDFGDAHLNLALCLLEAGDSAEAKPALDKAVALLAGQAEPEALARYLRAKVSMQEERPVDAVADLTAAVRAAPQFAEAWSDLGLAQKALNRNDDALLSFARSVQINPRIAITQYRLGNEYLRAGKIPDAVKHLEEAYRLNPKDQSTLYSLQRALLRGGQRERAGEIKEALQALLHARDLESENAMEAIRINNEGSVLEKQGKLAEALAKYQTAMRLDPAHIGIRINVGAALVRTGRVDEGIGLLEEALRLDPNNAELRAAIEQAKALRKR